MENNQEKFDNKELFEKPKATLDQFLRTGAIDKIQYDKSLNGLKEKNGNRECVMTS